MKILALETTERHPTLAATESEKLLAEIRLAEDQRSAQLLAPGIERLLTQVEWQPGDVELVAVTVGPGSFTGLRIGVATAKVFAYAAGAEVLGVDTHEALAAACPTDVDELWTVIDAQRGQIVARRFTRNGRGQLDPASESELLDIDIWLDRLTPEARVTGPILPRLAGRLPGDVRPLEPALWTPTAASVARLAGEQYAAGRRDDLWQLVPVYSRLSAAEEKRRGKQ